MTLSKFSTYVVAILTEFEIYWRRGAKVNPTQFIAEMEKEEWFEQFIVFVKNWEREENGE